MAPNASSAETPTGEPSNKLTILFLRCDKLPPEVIKSKGTYRDVIHGLFSPMLDATALELDTKMFDAVKRELPREKDIENADAVIISGSFEDDAHEDKQWLLRLAGWLIDVADNYPRVRIIGICFGLQIIARAFGPAKIVPNPKGWEIGSTEVRLTELGRHLVWGKDEDAPKHLMTQQIHADMVESKPDGFELLGSSELTPVQGLAKLYPEDDIPAFAHSECCCVPPEPWRRVHIIGWQGHPEWSHEIIIPFIDEYQREGVLDPEFAEKARERTKDPHDGLILGRALLAVMGVGDKCRKDVKGHVIEKEREREQALEGRQT